MDIYYKNLWGCKKKSFQVGMIHRVMLRGTTKNNLPVISDKQSAEESDRKELVLLLQTKATSRKI